MDKRNANLMESILDKILAYQSRQESGPEDIMLMLGLVNLFGIISVMNKHVEAAGPVAMSRQGGTDPLLTTLLTTLMTQRMQGGPDQEFNNPGGGGGLNPALLMSLLGNQGQRPDQALLMNLLAGMMNNPRPAASPPQQVRRQGGTAGPGPAEAVKPRRVAEAVAKPEDPGGENTRAPDGREEKPGPRQAGSGRSGPLVKANYGHEPDFNPESAPGTGGGMLVWDKRLG